MKNTTAILAIFILLFTGLACSSSGDETVKANALVDEANKFVADGNKALEDVQIKGKEFDTRVAAIDSNDDHKKVTEFADKELVPLYDKVRENYEKASEKFGEAGRLKLNEKFKQYLDVKASEFKKRAEYGAQLKNIPKTFASSKNEQEYQSAVKKDVEKAQQITKEANELGERATKLQTENPGIFKSN